MYQYPSARHHRGGPALAIPRENFSDGYPQRYNSGQQWGPGYGNSGMHPATPGRPTIQTSLGGRYNGSQPPSPTAYYRGSYPPTTMYRTPPSQAPHFYYCPPPNAMGHHSRSPQRYSTPSPSSSQFGGHGAMHVRGQLMPPPILHPLPNTQPVIGIMYLPPNHPPQPRPYSKIPRERCLSWGDDDGFEETSFGDDCSCSMSPPSMNMRSLSLDDDGDDGIDRGEQWRHRQDHHSSPGLARPPSAFSSPARPFEERTPDHSSLDVNGLSPAAMERFDSFGGTEVFSEVDYDPYPFDEGYGSDSIASDEPDYSDPEDDFFDDEGYSD